MRVSYQLLLSRSVFLLGLGETGLVGIIIGLGGLDPGLRRGRAGHCEKGGENERKKRRMNYSEKGRR